MPSRSAVLVMGPLGAWFVASVVGRDGSSFLASVAMSVISGTTGAASTTSLLRLHMTIDGWLAFWRISSEEHTSELQSPDHLVCRLLLEKKKNTTVQKQPHTQHSLVVGHRRNDNRPMI